MGTRRTFSREFKLEAVNLVRSRGVSMAPFRRAGTERARHPEANERTRSLTTFILHRSY